MKFAYTTAAAIAVYNTQSCWAKECNSPALCYEVSTSAGGPMNVAHVGESYTIDVAAVEDSEYPGPNNPFIDYGTSTVTLSLFSDAKQVGESIVHVGYEALYKNGASFSIPADSEFAKDGLFEFEVIAVVTDPSNASVVHTSDPETITVNVIPGASSLVPLIMTLIIAAATKDVYISLLTGIWISSFIETRYVFFDSIWRVFLFHIQNSFTDMYNAQIIFFTVFLGGCVALLTRSGGARGLAEFLGHYASTPMLGQFATWCSGLLIFFDDYSNAMVVGNSMRPITDKLGISREKLAFIVDATSAPIASIIPVSSWIAYETGLIGAELEKITPEQRAELGFDDETSALGVFLASVPYRYYPIVILIFQLFLMFTGLEFGPMLVYERRARYAKYEESRDEKLDSSEDDIVELDDDGLEPDEDTPRYWINGIVPIFMIVFLIIYFIAALGLEYCENACDAADVINSSDPFAALVMGSVASSIFLFLWYGIQRKRNGVIELPYVKSKAGGDKGQQQWLMSGKDLVDTYVRGITNLTPAIIVLLLAWSMGDSMEAVGTPKYFALAVNNGVDPGLIPALVFVMSALTALATGTSWGTMAIMFPLTGGIAAASGSAQLYYSTVGSILSGSVFGDHCSPISDTTVLSSIACRCNLLTHVYTQAPYAFFVAFFTVIFGDLIGGLTGMNAAGGVILSLLFVIVFALLISAPVNSASGRLDFYGRLVLYFHVRFGYEKEVHYLHRLQVRTAIAEKANPTRQFDPLGKFLGGSLAPGEASSTANIERVQSDDENQEDQGIKLGQGSEAQTEVTQA